MTHLSSPAAHAPDADSYVGRHRSHTRTARPLPMTELSGLTDAGVGVVLNLTDPHVILTSDWDQVVVTLSPRQRGRILAAAADVLESRAIEADLARQDAFYRVQAQAEARS